MNEFMIKRVVARVREMADAYGMDLSHISLEEHERFVRDGISNGSITEEQIQEILSPQNSI